MASAIPVSEAFRDELKEYTNKHGVTYEKFLRAVLSEVNTDLIDVEPDEGITTQSGTAASGRKDTRVNQILNDQDEPGDVVQRAMSMVKDAYDKGEFQRTHANTLAASAAYAARLLANKKHTQEQISERYGVSVQTIRPTYQKLINLKSKPDAERAQIERVYSMVDKHEPASKSTLIEASGVEAKYMDRILDGLEDSDKIEYTLDGWVAR